MRGVSESVEEVLTAISKSDFCSDFALIGGTALSLAIGHGLSEDLDFCTWNNQFVLESDFIVGSLRKLKGDFLVQQVMDSEHKQDFLINDVKVTFFKDPSGFVPEFEKKIIFNKLKIADVYSIAGMKACVALFRSKFRDYYDLFCLAHDHCTIRDIVGSALSLRPHLNARLVLQNITSLNEAQDENLALLKPIYNVSSVMSRMN